MKNFEGRVNGFYDEFFFSFMQESRRRRKKNVVPQEDTTVSLMSSSSRDVGGDACKNCGPHFDTRCTPQGGTHGSRRHAGDLGNVMADASGNVRAQVTIPW